MDEIGVRFSATPPFTMNEFSKSIGKGQEDPEQPQIVSAEDERPLIDILDCRLPMFYKAVGRIPSMRATLDSDALKPKAQLDD
jgi:hypothetical protein